MGKQVWKPGNMLYPLPVVLVTMTDGDKQNIFTVAWAGTVCTNPPMVSISVRPERYSYDMIRRSGEFVLNLTTKELAYAADYCGVRSGRDVDKLEYLKLNTLKAEHVKAPLLADSPVSIECRVIQVQDLGSHHMFVAEVLAVHADEKYLDEKGRFDLAKSEPIVYSHGTYYDLGEAIGTFGYSVRRQNKKAGSKT